MNRLQAITSKTPYFVSLNAVENINKKHLLHQVNFSHPIFNQRSVATQANLQQLNKTGPVYFCGSYFGNGFHEDGIRSAVNLARHLEVSF